MSIDEQLIELVGQHVDLAFIPEEEYSPRPLTVKQDYQYGVDWISFTSEDVLKVLGTTIFFRDEFIQMIGAVIDTVNPRIVGDGQGLTSVTIPDYERYNDRLFSDPEAW